MLAQNADRINFAKLEMQLADAGLVRRFGWVLENTLVALERELAAAPPRSWGKVYQRAAVVLDGRVAALSRPPATTPRIFSIPASAAPRP